MLSGCTYQVMHKSNSSAMKSKVAHSCSYAPLWLAPMNSDYANVDKIAQENGITNVTKVEHKVYPFVLFTKSCMHVHGE